MIVSVYLIPGLLAGVNLKINNN